MYSPNTELSVFVKYSPKFSLCLKICVSFICIDQSVILHPVRDLKKKSQHKLGWEPVLLENSGAGVKFVVFVNFVLLHQDHTTRLVSSSTSTSSCCRIIQFCSVMSTVGGTYMNLRN